MTLSGGTLDLNGHAQTIPALNFQSGALTQAGAALSLSSGTTALTMRNLTISGPVNLTASGAIVFDATNNGTATISGNVNLGGGTVSCNVANGTASTDMEISGAISNGAVLKTGAGTLQLSGTSNYGGGTTINQGVLVVNADPNLGAGNVTLNGGNLQGSGQAVLTKSIQLMSPSTLGAAPGNTLTLGTVNQLTGSAALSIQGGGTVSVTANQSFSGLVTISDASVLQVNAAFSASITLLAGRLQGTGSTGAVTNTGGTVKPGNSIGTITFASFSQGPAGTLSIELNAAQQSSLVIVTNGASLDGTLAITADPGTYFRGAAYTILTGMPVTGTFANVTVQGAPLMFSVLYSSSFVQLVNLTQELFTGFDIRPHNPRHVKNYLQGMNYANNDPLLNVVLQLDQINTQQGLINALNLLHPAPFGAFGPLVNTERAYASSLYAKRCQTHCREEITLWTEPYSLVARQRPVGEQRGYHSPTGGLLVGSDGRFGHYFLGGALGGGMSYVRWDSHAADAHRQEALAAVYGGYTRPYLCIEGSFTAALDWYQTKRYIQFAAVSETAKAKYRGFDWNAHLGVSTKFRPSDRSQIRPYALVDYTELYQPSYTERNAGALNLHVDRKRNQWLRGEAGVMASSCFSYESHTFTPSVGAAWIGSASVGGNNYNTFFLSEGGLFTVRTWHRYSSRWAPMLDLAWKWDGGSVSFYYGTEIGTRMTLYKNDLRVRVEF